MTDATTPPAPQASAEGQPMKIGIGAQYIKDMSFESPSAPHIFAPSKAAPEITVGVNVQSRALAENTYEVVLSIKLDAKLETQTAYIAELAYAGVFMAPPMSEENLRLFLLVEGPRLLFPYARAIVSTAVRDGGFAPVMLSPVDFFALYQANKGSLGTTAAQGAA